MAKRVQFRRGTSEQHNSFTGALGEITVDTTLKTLRVHDNVEVGGSIIATQDFVEDTISTIEGDVSTIEGDIATIEGDIATIAGRATTLEGRATTLEGRATTLEGRATAIEDALPIIAADISLIDNTTVKLTGDQTIEDIITFALSPIVPTPTTAFEAATKQYVDSKPININNMSNKAAPINTDSFVLQEVGGNLRKVNYENLTKLNPNDSRIKVAVNAGGNAPIYACRAWVNFNGETPVAIRDSRNVSSVLDRGKGRYSINFTTPMPNANYVAVSASPSRGGLNSIDSNTVVKTVTTLNVSATIADSSSYKDFDQNNWVVFA